MFSTVSLVSIHDLIWYIQKKKKKIWDWEFKFCLEKPFHFQEVRLDLKKDLLNQNVWANALKCVLQTYSQKLLCLKQCRVVQSSLLKLGLHHLNFMEIFTFGKLLLQVKGNTSSFFFSSISEYGN